MRGSWPPSAGSNISFVWWPVWSSAGSLLTGCGSSPDALVAGVSRTIMGSNLLRKFTRHLQHLKSHAGLIPRCPCAQDSPLWDPKVQKGPEARTFG